MKYSYNWLKEIFKDKLPEVNKLSELLNYHIAETTISKLGNDHILDIEVPANRIADLGGHLGIARDISAFLNLKLKPIPKNKIKISNTSSSDLSIEIKDKKDCLQYCGLLIENVKIKPSCKEIQKKLISCGLRPINNIVDITNLVMLKYGQPMHAFDYAKISGHKIIVRKAKAGENIDTLDDKQRKLNEHILVIADKEKPLAIAGIKGGEDAGIDKATKDIVLESANFNSVSIYKTSKSLNLTTDASVRFAHGLPPELTLDAIQRAAELIIEHANGKISGPIIQNTLKTNPTIILLNLEKIYRFLGFNISTKFIEQVFTKLEFKFTKRNPKLYIVTVPYWRQDIKTDDDLSGEIGRIFGFNNIPLIPPSTVLSSPIENDLYSFKQGIKNYSIGMGLSEIHEYNFIGAKEEKILDKSEFFKIVNLLNPQSSDYKYLRPFSLVSSLHAVSTNVKYFPSAKMFEISKNFLNISNILSESNVYSFALYNSKAKAQKSELILESKGIFESLFEKFGISEEDYYTSNKLPDNLKNLYSPFISLNETITFYTNSNKFIGALFIPNNKTLDAYNISIEHKQPVVVLGEINLDEFFALVKREIEFKPLPKYPASIRDIAILVPSNVLIQDVYLAINKSGVKNLIDVDLFDIYEGKETSGDKKSLSFHLIFRSEDHTLVEQEINKDFDIIVSNIKKQGWQVR